jgi:hypothetical protein
MSLLGTSATVRPIICAPVMSGNNGGRPVDGIFDNRSGSVRKILHNCPLSATNPT